MLHLKTKGKNSLIAMSTALLFISACSSTDDSEFDDPIEIVDYNDSYGEESQVIDDYSESSADESLGHSEITSPEAVDEALYGTDSTDDSNSYDDTESSIESTLSELTIPQDSDTVGDSEPYLPEYQAETTVASPILVTETVQTDDYMNPPAIPASTTAETYSPVGQGGSYGEYIVQPGDTLSAIAFRVLGSSSLWRELSEQNAINNPSRILPGDVIRYPLTERSEQFQSLYAGIQTETVTVQSGDTLSRIAKRVLGKSSYWRTIWRLNADVIPDPNRIEVGQSVRYVDPSKLQSQLSAKGWAGFGH
ncbi:MAG: LysM peptidoglycan-binding domain-containing protein [Oligoflexus sp.]